MKKQKIVVIVGPTASGKTALGIRLAKQFNGEVISADSRQVYRRLDIGTGKVTKREMAGVKHHMLDVASPRRVFSAGDYVKAARRSIDDISRRGKLPIVVGGTGFYIDALVGRISLPEVSPNPELRAHLHKKSAAQLYALLKHKDPVRARAMATPSERNNKVRLIRALEIAHTLHHTKNIKDGPLYEVLWLGIRPIDTELRTRINKRLVQRLKIGMAAEATRLHKAGLSYKRMLELGLEYRSLARLLQGKITKPELVAELQRDIWRYARKQLGYWKRNGDIHWFKPVQRTAIEREVKRWLQK